MLFPMVSFLTNLFFVPRKFNRISTLKGRMFPYKSILFKVLIIVVKFNIFLLFCWGVVQSQFCCWNITWVFFWKGSITSDVSELDIFRSRFGSFMSFTSFWIRLLRKCCLPVSVTATILELMSWFIEVHLLRIQLIS